MNNIIKPFKGVGDISFGTERSIIRKKICYNFKEIRRSEYAENTSDYFEENGVFIEYLKDNICEAIEFTRDSCLFYYDTELFSLTFSSIKKMFDKLSSNKEVEDEIGVTYFDLGIGIACEYGTDNIESIIVFSENYWQK